MSKAFNQWNSLQHGNSIGAESTRMGREGASWTVTLHDEDVLFFMSRVRDKAKTKQKKTESPDWSWIHAFPHIGLMFYPLNCWETSGEIGHLLGSYVTLLHRSARISEVKSVLCGGKWRKMANVKLGEEMRKTWAWQRGVWKCRMQNRSNTFSDSQTSFKPVNE